jgi:phytoene dehydrogenase-like protein
LIARGSAADPENTPSPINKSSLLEGPVEPSPKSREISQTASQTPSPSQQEYPPAGKIEDIRRIFVAGDLSRAKAELRAIGPPSDDAHRLLIEIHYALATRLLKDGMPQESAQELGQVLALSSQHDGALLLADQLLQSAVEHFMRAYALELSQTDQARHHYQDVIAICSPLKSLPRASNWLARSRQRLALLD